MRTDSTATPSGSPPASTDPAPARPARAPDEPAAERVVDGRRTKPYKLAHVVFRVHRYRECIDWYTSLLDAAVMHSDAKLTFLTYDQEHHRVALVHWPEGPARHPDSTGLEHVAFTYPSLGDLLNTYVRLRDEGILPYWTVNHGPTISLYYRDPDGNQVELQIDNYPDPNDFIAWYLEGTFADNPLGVDFAPEVLLERYRDGDPMAELVRQGSA